MGLDKHAIGLRISNIRKEKGLTLEEFGNLVGNAGKSIVSRWEHGISVPNNARLKKISELGNVPLEELIYGDMSTFLLLNLQKLIPVDYRFMIKDFTVDSLVNIADKIKQAKISILEIEKIKLILEEEIPLIISQSEENFNKKLNFISQHIQYQNQTIEYFSETLLGLNKKHLDDINYIFENSTKLTLEEKFSFKSIIDDVETYLLGITNNETLYTDGIAILVTENELIHKLQEIDLLNNKESRNFFINYKHNFKTSTDKFEQHLLMIEIEQDNMSSLISKGCNILVNYFPNLNYEILSKFYIGEKIVIIKNDIVFIGTIDKKLFFTSLDKKQSIDLQNISIKNKVFPLLAIFY